MNVKTLSRLENKRRSLDSIRVWNQRAEVDEQRHFFEKVAIRLQNEIETMQSKTEKIATEGVDSPLQIFPEKIEKNSNETSPDSLRIFHSESIQNGSGLFHCESPEQAKNYLKIVAPHLPEGLAITIVRERELNIYSWESVLFQNEDNIASDETGIA